MQNGDQYTVSVTPHLFKLLQRCSKIEMREINEIITSLLGPYLEKYTYDTLEQWEEAKETLELQKMLGEFEVNDNFNPNEIPFNTQILGLRKKLYDIDREIETSKSTRPDLEHLKFTILEDLNYAEKEALQKQQDEHLTLSEKWKSVCSQIALSQND